MRIEELSSEQVERAKGCETDEERKAFIAENGIDLTDEQLEDIAGGEYLPSCGDGGCPKTSSGMHKYV